MKARTMFDMFDGMPKGRLIALFAAVLLLNIALFAGAVWFVCWVVSHFFGGA